MTQLSEICRSINHKINEDGNLAYVQVTLTPLDRWLELTIPFDHPEGSMIDIFIKANNFSVISLYAVKADDIADHIESMAADYDRPNTAVIVLDGGNYYWLKLLKGADTSEQCS